MKKLVLSINESKLDGFLATWVHDDTKTTKLTDEVIKKVGGDNIAELNAALDALKDRHDSIKNICFTITEGGDDEMVVKRDAVFIGYDTDIYNADYSAAKSGAKCVGVYDTASKTFTTSDDVAQADFTSVKNEGDVVRVLNSLMPVKCKNYLVVIWY